MPGTNSGMAPPCEGNLQCFLNEEMAEWRRSFERVLETKPRKLPVEG